MIGLLRNSFNFDRSFSQKYKMSPRTEKQFERIRSEKVKLITETALRLFAMHGYEATSVSMIAGEAGISKGLMYNYFKSKEDLLWLVTIGGLHQFLDLLKVEDEQNIKRAEIISFIDGNIKALKENPEYFSLYFSLILQPKVMELFKEDMMPHFEQLFVKIAKYYTQKGEKNPYLKARYLMAVFDGIGIHYISDTENFPLDDIRDILVEQL